jgi:hypothetical protein
METNKDYSSRELNYTAPQQQSDTFSDDDLTSRQNTERSILGEARENIRNLAVCSFSLIALGMLVATANTMTKQSADDSTDRQREQAAKKQQLEEAARRRAAEQRVRDEKAAREAARRAKRPPL